MYRPARKTRNHLLNRYWVQEHNSTHIPLLFFYLIHRHCTSQIFFVTDYIYIEFFCIPKLNPYRKIFKFDISKTLCKYICNLYGLWIFREVFILKLLKTLLLFHFLSGVILIFCFPALYSFSIPPHEKNLYQLLFLSIPLIYILFPVNKLFKSSKIIYTKILASIIYLFTSAILFIIHGAYSA